MRVRYARYLSIAASAACVSLVAQELALTRSGDQIRVNAPTLNFLAGKPLDRLRKGVSVTYDMQLSVLGDNRQVLRRGFERFVVSYDLWEENFSVTRMRTTRASASRLSPEAVRIWCWNHISVPIAGLATVKPVRVQLEVRALEPKERRTQDDEEGISLSRLIDLFSRAAASPGSGSYWRVESGPVDLQKLNP